MTEADREWKKIIDSEICKHCMFFKKRTNTKRSRCKNPNRPQKIYYVECATKACKDYDEYIDNYVVNLNDL
jgi:hypothetical protein